jgi:hypothetical protein
MLPTKIWFIWPSDFREDLYKSVNQKQVLPVATMFINRSGRCNLSRGPSIDAKSFGSFGQAVSEVLFLVISIKKIFSSETEIWKVLYQVSSKQNER